MNRSEALLERIRRLEETALTEVYDEYAPALYRYAYRLTGHQETAQDIVAETFHRFLVALKNGGGPETQLSAWLYRVAHNLVVDLYRKQPSQEPVSSDSYDDYFDDAIGIAEPSRSEERLLEQEQIEQARAALHQLTSLQQQVIVLRFLQGMSNVEIAEVIQKNVGAVKALQHRALNALRRIIQEKENET